MSTISFADIYGTGPNNRSAAVTAPPDKEKASGATELSSDNKPAVSWVGLVFALVLIRVLWEMA